VRNGPYTEARSSDDKLLEGRVRRKMTLIITLVAPWEAFQSSDYCLSDPDNGKTVQVSAGTKQISAMGTGWNAEIAFTGIARVGSYQTRDWISTAFASNGDNYSLSNIVPDLVHSGSKQLRKVAARLRYLSVCILTVEKNSVRFILISNFESLYGKPLPLPDDRLSVSETLVTRPKIFIHGLRESVSRSDRMLLIGMLKHKRTSTEILATLERVNRRASTQSAGRISSECMLSDLRLGGQSGRKNIGAAQGIPDSFLMGINIGEMIKKNFRHEHGRWQVLKNGDWVDAETPSTESGSESV
jgi:hypothetical protein